jgi:uncharacterized membrane protein
MIIPRHVYPIILGLTIAWCGAIVAAPLLAGLPGMSGMISRGLYRFFHTICHQFDGRSLHLVGHPLGVCSRCTAIYGSFLVGILVFPWIRGVRNIPLQTRWILLAAALPMLIDVVLGHLGIYEPSNTYRIATGSVFGFLAALVILPDAMEGTTRLVFSFKQQHHNHPKGYTDASKA